MNGNYNESVRPSQKPILLKWMWVAILAILGNLSALNAQCVCATTTLNLSADANCMALIDPGQIFTNYNTAQCPTASNFQLIARELNGTPIDNQMNSLSFDVTSYLNQTIEVLLFESGMNMPTCTRSVLIEDKLHPVFTSCPATTQVTCGADIPAPNEAALGVMDNCGSDFTVTMTETSSAVNCVAADPVYFTVTRNWTASQNGLAGSAIAAPPTCTETIEVLKGSLSDIAPLPSPVNLSCEQDPTDLTLTGRLMFMNGLAVPFPGQNVCNINATFQDMTPTVLPCDNIVIERVWTIFDDCTPASPPMQTSQVINLTDTDAPVVSNYPTVADINTNPGTCVGAINFTNPTATDNCTASGNLTYTFEVNGINYNSGAVLPVGTNYELVYTVTDMCGNSTDNSASPTSFNVLDNETPTTICKPKTVNLTNNGSGFLFASATDDGSSDNCTSTNSLALDIKRMGAPDSDYANQITFTCADLVPGEVMYILRVTDAAGNSNTCMNTATIFDKLAPQITCPADVTANCTDNFTDLSVFGTVTVNEPCGPANIVETSTGTVDNCGNGTIVRTFTVTDSSDNESVCSQTITVIDPTPFVGTDITWPTDYEYTTGDCPDPTTFAPSSLPAGNDEPTWVGDECSMIGTSYSDMIFDINAPSCYKVVRKWEVMDWCQYDPALPASPANGVWSYNQQIKVMDNIDPTLTVPTDITVALDATCTSGLVNLFSASATDGCNSELTFTNEIVGTTTTYATNTNSADAAGTYPAGTYTIRFTVKDGCGNTTSNTAQITVADLTKPYVNCNNGLVTEFMQSGMAMTNTSFFNYQSTDNCTAPADLMFFIEETANGDGMTVPTTTELTFDCTYANSTVQINFWVVDEAGNADYCIAPLILQDNMNACSTEIPNPCPPGAPDNDNDGLCDAADPDDNDPCIPNGTDLDNDGVCDTVDPDIDPNPCTPTSPDADGDGVCDDADPNDFDPCVPNGTDIDGDGVCETSDPNDLDPCDPLTIANDADGDGICDLIDPTIETPCEDLLGETITTMIPGGQPIEVCLNIEISAAETYDIIVDGAQYVAPLVACGSESQLFYSYAPVSGMGSAGPYNVIWDYGTGTLITTVANMDELVTEMNYVDPNGDWINQPTLFIIRGGATGTTYGDIDIQSTNGIVSNIQTNTTTFQTGTQLTFPDYGDYTVVLNLPGTTCSETININIAPDDDGLVVATIAGNLVTEEGDNISDVIVNTMINGANSLPYTTGNAGDFAFENQQLGYDYMVQPVKNTDLTNGVTTYDMVLMGKHVLGIQPLDSPYKIIAADVNNSGAITTYDMVLLQKVILGIIEEFPNNNSWRFIDMYYEFPDPTNPFSEDIPEEVYLNDLNEDVLNNNFVGVKVGDVNCSAQSNTEQDTDNRSTDTKLMFNLENQTFEEGELISIPVYSQNFNQVAGYQTTLEFNASQLAYNGIEPGSLTSMNEDNIGTNEAEQGFISLSWYDFRPVTVNDETPLFTLYFEAMSNGVLNNQLAFSDALIVNEAYKTERAGTDLRMPLELQLTDDTGAVIDNASGVLYQNYPNPFIDQTIIPFTMEAEGAGTLTIYDLSGKVMWQTEGSFVKGYNEIIVNRQYILQSGIYYYQLDTEYFTASKKMIVK